MLMLMLYRIYILANAHILVDAPVFRPLSLTQISHYSSLACQPISLLSSAYDAAANSDQMSAQLPLFLSSSERAQPVTMQCQVSLPVI